MTAVTVLSEFPAMSVLRTVAVDTVRRFANPRRHGRLMTGHALEAFMRTVKRKIRLRIVIEPPECPGIGVVAALTFRPERSSMHVVGRMTGLACNVFLLEGMITMA